MTQELLRADGIFKRIHDELVGNSVEFDLFDPSSFDKELVEHARAVWSTRVQSEFHSIQVMARFTQEIVGAGDPLEVYAGAADAILDEIRHTALCVGMLEALGGVAQLPDPITIDENPEFLSMPMPQRALATAISMLAISETLSTGFIEDLYHRCNQPVVKAVLKTTMADEETHHAFGWQYVTNSLERFDDAGIEFGQMVVQATLQGHLASAEQVLNELPMHQRHLDAWPEPELVALGLLSPQREALLFQHILQTQVAPKLSALHLL